MLESSLIRVIPSSGPNDPATTRLVHTLRDNRAAIEGQTGAHILWGSITRSQRLGWCELEVLPAGIIGA